MNKKDSLKNHLLVAMPSLQDSTFSRAVVYIHEHSESGAMGILINKPLTINLGSVLTHLGIVTEQKDVITLPVLMGGPVGQEHGFVVYQQKTSKRNKPIDVSASKEMLEKIAAGDGPSDFLVTLGYAGWSSGQLEKEISQNDWLIVPAEKHILFNTPISQRWKGAAQLINVDTDRLSTFIGHG